MKQIVQDILPSMPCRQLHVNYISQSNDLIGSPEAETS